MTDKPRRRPEDLRSHRWFGTEGLRTFGHQSRIKQMGFARYDYMGKPMIAIINTWSDINPCHYHFKQRVEEVKRGVWQAGGFPVELPAMSLSEPMVKPSTMLYRNFLAMEVEELLRSHPVDGAVLMGGCDKTTPALLMGAISMDIPAIFMPAGPMLRGNWGGEILGSGSDSWKYWDELRAGNITESDWHEIEGGIARSFGHCMTMGTAATMTSVAEAMGMTLSGASSIPAADANHPRMATATGRRAVEMVWQDQRPSALLSAGSFDNAIRCLMALGGSTNAIIHIIVMARRAGVDLGLERFDEIAREVPVVANLRPAGEFLMEDFFYAGGLRGLLAGIADKFDLDCKTVTGQTLGEDIAGARVFKPEVIRGTDAAIYPEGSLAVLRGNLAPDGCVMKPAAAEPHLHRHTGPALAFKDSPELKANIDRDDLEVTADSVLVLQNAGPQGAPGMPEWGMLPIPKKLLKQGVRDMLRISDSRMSGTSYGACILHVAPEAAIGGPLALVQTGDMISVDVAARGLELRVEDTELERRRAAWQAPPRHYGRGYGAMFARHIEQANEGCDFDFLLAGDEIPEPAIF